jgi:thiosulfate sulfurtransferase
MPKQIDTSEVKKILENNSAHLIDIRDPQSYKGSHIKNANWLSAETLKNFLSTADKNKPLICYCYHGISSQMAAEFFESNGFQDVYSMIGGFEAWQKKFPMDVQTE